MMNLDPALMMIPGLELEKFERLIYKRNGSQEDYQKCGQALLVLLHQVRMGCGFFGMDERRTAMAHTRLAGAITHLLIDPNFPIGDDAFMALCGQIQELHLVFRASAYENLDHVIHAGGEMQANGQLLFSNRAVLVLMLCWSLDSDMDLDIEHMFKESPVGTHAAIVALLGGMSSVSEQGYARRLLLMSKLEILGSQPMPPQLVNAASDYYMHCTYTDAPNKHACKPIINDWFRDLAWREAECPQKRPQAVNKDRPTIVICLEWFHIHHAIYRCYATALAQLRKRFRTVCIYRKNEADDDAVKIFDKAVPIGSMNVSIRSVIDAITSESPDIIFYPSVGMGATYLAVSNLRLAAVQIVGPGHPASTFSPAIDYLIAEEPIIGDRANYSETVYSIGAGTCRFQSRLGFTPTRRDHPDAIRSIAIPAMASKIIPPFLRALQQIKAACPEVTYHFFPNMITMKHYVVTQELRRWFPDCVVYDRSDYAPYMENLGKCQLALDTFPFGGTNSTIDCLLMGVPIITLENDDVSGRPSAAILRRLRIESENCIVRTPEEYVKAAIALIKHPHWMPEMPSAEVIERELFGDGPPECQDEFLRAFERIWETACKS